MQREAEEQAEEDKRKREEIEARNEAGSAAGLLFWLTIALLFRGLAKSKPNT